MEIQQFCCLLCIRSIQLKKITHLKQHKVIGVLFFDGIIEPIINNGRKPITSCRLLFMCCYA